MMTELVSVIREASGAEADILLDLRIIRLLHAQRWDVLSTVAVVDKYVELANRYDRDLATPMVEEVLRSGRFCYMGLNRDLRPVVVVHHMWGAFLDIAGGSSETLLDAYVLFMRRAAKRVAFDLGPDVVPEFLTICVGGPPPKTYFAEWLELRKAYFPELATGVVVYPVDYERSRGPFSFMFSATYEHMGITHWMGPSNQIFRAVSTPAELRWNIDVSEGVIPDDLLDLVKIQDQASSHGITSAFNPSEADDEERSHRRSLRLRRAGGARALTGPSPNGDSNNDAIKASVHFHGNSDGTPYEDWHGADQTPLKSDAQPYIPPGSGTGPSSDWQAYYPDQYNQHWQGFGARQAEYHWRSQADQLEHAAGLLRAEADQKRQTVADHHLTVAEHQKRSRSVPAAAHRSSERSVPAAAEAERNHQ